MMPERTNRVGSARRTLSPEAFITSTLDHPPSASPLSTAPGTPADVAGPDDRQSLLFQAMLLPLLFGWQTGSILWNLGLGFVVALVSWRVLPVLGFRTTSFAMAFVAYAVARGSHGGTSVVGIVVLGAVVAAVMSLIMMWRRGGG